VAPIASIQPGKVRGRIDDGAAVFLGIPFAAPPFGANRFAGPQPVAVWDGVRDAYTYLPTAPQPHRQFTLVPEPVMDGDDCLNLNVFTPDVGAAGLPVLVWIHGGGFTAGCNASPWYRGTRFARDGIVLVSVNYRLGAEGFLAMDGAPLNRGVRDWVAALEWVRDNIAAFGGDPDKVTIAGQSAGGVACAALLTCPPAQGLFRSAICMSGSRMGWASSDAARSFGRTLASELGVEPSRDALAAIDPSQIVGVQDAATAAANRETRSDSVRLNFGPVIDGEYVVERPYEHLDPSLPVMLGATAEEFNATVGNLPGGVDEARLERRLGRMGLDDAAIRAYRTGMAGAEPWQILGQAVTDSAFKAPALRLADALSAAGGSAFLYDFEWKSSRKNMGSVHCLDIPFAFDNLDADGVVEVTGPEPPQALADSVHSAWVRFIKDGDPGWDTYDRQRQPAMLFDETSKMVEDPWSLARQAWLK
jgi:para-nitrobenzyl esterase